MYAIVTTHNNSLRVEKESISRDPSYSFELNPKIITAVVPEETVGKP